MLKVEACLQGVRGYLRAKAQGGPQHTGPQTVAAMLHVRAHASLLGVRRLVEPVLATNVVGFLLAR